MLRIAVASSAVAVALGCFPTCDDDCNRLSPPQLGEVTRLRKLKEKCTSGEEVVFNVDYNPCTHNLDYKVRTPDNCEQRQGNVFTCKNNKRCKVIPFLTELKFCDCSSSPGPSPPTTPTNPCGSKCGAEEICYMRDVICNTFSCHPVPTCITNHCMFSKCGYGNDCVITDHGDSSTCKPWSEIGCFDKPCKAGYTCVDVKRVCKTAPCYQYECSWEAPAPVHCTAEAKKCPDGSSVGRDSNNNCEFHPCPDPCGGSCLFNQDCLIQKIKCPEGMVCTPRAVCFDKPCNRRCPKGDVCEHMVAPCLIPPCPVVETCKTVVQPKCDKKCPKGEVCEIVVAPCLTPPCPEFPTCKPVVQVCTDDAKQCQDGSFVGRDSNNNCEFHPCPDPCDGACKFNQDCLLKNVITCPEGMVCPPTVVCVDKPCNKKCPKGDVCELIVAPCLIPPCPVVETCKPLSPPTTPTNPCGSKCGAEEICYMRDIICNTFSCHPVPTCITNHCMFSKCGYGNDCVITDHGDSSTCKPWSEIGCSDKPCKAGYTCVDVKRVCKTAPCYQYECSWEAPAPVHCTAEAKKCPDGSSVGRDSNNNCEFHPCPDPCGGSCLFNQDCLIQKIKCPEGMVCTPRAVCFDKPCNKKCPKGDVCEHMVAPCLIPPCPVVETCKTVVQPKCDKKCPKGEVCEIVVAPCLIPPCPEFPTCKPVVQVCTDDAKQCQDGSFVGRDSNNNCEFHPCPDPCDGACKFNQDCLLKNVITCPEGMVCPPIVVCVDKPCNRRCPKGDVCELMVAPCLIPPCPVVETCKIVVQPKCDKECPKGEECELIDTPCPFPPCSKAEICSPIGCGDDLKDCSDGSSVERDPKNGCQFFPCPVDGECEDEDDCEGWNFCIEGKCVDAFEGTCNSVKDCNGYGCYYNDNKEPTCRTTCMGEPTWLCDKNHLCLGDECVDMKQCKTNCGNLVPHLFKGNDDGDNSCNECTCFNGDYSCTERGCTGDETCGGPSPPTTPTNPCGSKCGAEEICYMRDVICNTFSCHPVPTCITNHCMFSKCEYGNDCVITDHGDSSTCKPWSEIGCFDKPCKAGYTCVDVKRVCKTAPCYQYECSWEAPAPVHCTADAKKCPDGSSVGRDSNNNCEFHPCPDPCGGSCLFNQDCLIQKIKCPEGMVCTPRAVCFDKPCNRRCPKGDVCEHMVAPCLIPPCPVVETCKTVVQPKCDKKCPKGEVCEIVVAPCLIPPCPEFPTCKPK